MVRGGILDLTSTQGKTKYRDDSCSPRPPSGLLSPWTSRTPRSSAPPGPPPVSPGWQLLRVGAGPAPPGGDPGLAPPTLGLAPPPWSCRGSGL